MKHINRFSIIYNSETTVLEHAPIGWDDRNRTLKRSESAIGLFRTFTADMVFVKDGFKLLNSIWESDGINADVQFKAEKMNTKTGIYQAEPLMKFDFTEFSFTTENGKGIKIALISSGFEQTLTARKSIEVPYDRLETIDGGTITPFPSIDSDFGDGNTFHDTDGYKTAKIFGIDVADKGIPYTFDQKTYASDDNNRNVIVGISTDYNSPLIQNVAEKAVDAAYGSVPAFAVKDDCFFYTDGYAKVSYNINLKFNHRSTLLLPDTWDLYIDLYKMAFDVNGSPILARCEHVYTIHHESGPLWNYEFNTNSIINLLPREGLLISVYHYASGLFAQSSFTVNPNSIISLDYADKYNTTFSKYVLPHEAFTRVIESITGIADGLYAQIFGRTDLGYDEDGEFAYIGLTDGMLLRNFPAGYVIDSESADTNKVAQLTFTFEKLFDFYNKNKCLGWSIDTIDGIYKVRIEKREYFFNDSIIAVVPPIEMRSFTKTINTDLFVNSAIFGCEVADYEETSGLEEYCGKSEFATCIKPVDNKLELITEYKTACYAVEYCRRYPIDEYSTRDTQYDDYVFITDLIKDIDGNLMQLTTEGFTTIEGIPLITTPMNLNLTPVRSLLRWGFWLNSGLWKYPSSNLVYSKSSFVTDLRTIKNGESELVYENRNMLNSRLGMPVLSGFKIEFSAPLTNEIWDLVQLNTGGIFQLTDKITNQVIYMAIDSITNEPVKSNANNWSGYEVFPPDKATLKFLVNETGLILINDENYFNELM
jgi:hypothetical protein